MTITITGDSIPLPKTLAKKWHGRRVILRAEPESLIFESEQVAEAWQELLRGPKGLMRPADIEREIQTSRAERRERTRRS